MIRIAALLFLVACGGKSAPAPTPAPTEPAPATTPAPPVEASTKCATDGGMCTNKTATVVCKQFAEGAEWGCGQDQGCCLN